MSEEEERLLKDNHSLALQVITHVARKCDNFLLQCSDTWFGDRKGIQLVKSSVLVC